MENAEPTPPTPEPAVMFVKPGAIAEADRAALREAGIIVVEIENPADARFVRPRRQPAEMPHGDLLAAAARVIGGSEHAQKLFGAYAAETIVRRSTKRTQ